MKKWALTYKYIAGRMALVCGIISAISTVALVLLTVGDVFLRYFFNSPILGSFELTEYLLIPIIFFAIPWATMEKANVRIDLIVGKLRQKNRAVIYAVSCFLSMVVTFSIAWYTVPQIAYIHRIKVRSDMLRIPAYPFYFLVAVGLFMLFFVLIANLIDFIDEAVNQ
jgi:TRAP-type C4-dicarboxylate transport system permease small subunit